jgi:anaphase-promoting complex subunit 8
VTTDGDRYGLVLKELELKGQAATVFSASVAHYPWNWSAWHALSALCQDRDQLDKLALPEHWIKPFFVAHTCLELQRNTDSLALYEQLAQTFGHTNYILAQTALGNYNLKGNASARPHRSLL